MKVRVSAEQRARWREAAGREPLSAWCRRAIEAELERQAVDVEAPATSSPTLDELLARVRA